MRSRPLQWIHRNPLLIVRTHAFSGSYYENQFLLTTHLHFATAFVSLLSILSRRPHNDNLPLWSSSSRVNNFQTLDIKHYLVFQRPRRKWLPQLDLQCIPMNMSQAELAELSDLNIELDPREWRRRKSFVEEVRLVIRTMQSGYAKHCISARVEGADFTIYRKMHDALAYFKRSFRIRNRTSDAIINLAIAFEVLLSDFYVRGVTQKIISRSKTLLRGVRGYRKCWKSVEDLFSQRGAVVHSGKSPSQTDLYQAQKAFAYCFLRLAKKFPKGPMKNVQEPIRHLIEKCK